jgi:hypothetical protein
MTARAALLGTPAATVAEAVELAAATGASHIAIANGAREVIAAEDGVVGEALAEGGVEVVGHGVLLGGCLGVGGGAGGDRRAAIIGGFVEPCKGGREVGLAPARPLAPIEAIGGASGDDEVEAAAGVDATPMDPEAAALGLDGELGGLRALFPFGRAAEEQGRDAIPGRRVDREAVLGDEGEREAAALELGRPALERLEGGGGVADDVGDADEQAASETLEAVDHLDEGDLVEALETVIVGGPGDAGLGGEFDA